jgi:hypothetical protein
MTQEIIELEKQITEIKEQIKETGNLSCGKCLKKLKRELALLESKLDQLVS